MKKTFEITLSHSGEVVILVDRLSIDKIYKETFYAASPEELQKFVTGLLGRNTQVLPKYSKQDPSNFAFKRWHDMLYSVSEFSLTAASQLFYNDVEHVVWMNTLVDSDSFVKIREVS